MITSTIFVHETIAETSLVHASLSKRHASVKVYVNETDG